jgi:hypothetical protein
MESWTIGAFLELFRWTAHIRVRAPDGNRLRTRSYYPQGHALER